MNSYACFFQALKQAHKILFWKNATSPREPSTDYDALS